MNFALLNAEMEVRKSRWGPDIGGLSEDMSIKELLKEKVVERLRDQDAITIKETEEYLEKLK